MHVLGVLHSVGHARDRRHPRRPCRLNARPLHGKNVNVVAIVPFVEASIARSGDWTVRAAASEADGPYRHLRRRGVCKEELVLSVATAADPMPEADARKASEVPNGNEEQRLGCRRAEGPTVPQVTPVPTLTTEGGPRAVEDVTVGDEGVVGGAPATILSDPLLPPTSEDDGCVRGICL